MADFCNQCANEHFPPGHDRDLAGLVSPEQFAAGFVAYVLCEGCGHIAVDPDGKCVSEDCLKRHGDTHVHKT